MRHDASRHVAAIDADLRSLRAVNRDAQGELVEVRRRKFELDEIEADLVAGLEARARGIDEALDERLRATSGGSLLSGPSEMDRRRSGSAGRSQRGACPRRRM